VIFLLVAILISHLVGRAKIGLEAALAREQEATRLYELSIGLAGVNDLKEIAGVIARYTAETFSAVIVEIIIEQVQGENPFTVSQGGQVSRDQYASSYRVPLKTIRRPLGEIRIWRKQKTFSPAEERLLHTFAAQGALALERAALAHTETRARVLEESDRLKSALLSSVSHEFRTPLVTIKAATTSLLSCQVAWNSEDREALLTAVDEEADNLNYLVGNLLNMSKIEAGAMRPSCQWNVLTEIIEGTAVRLHRILISHRLCLDVPEDLPLVYVDYQQIEQVFTNLLSNSAKYAPQDTEIVIQAGRADLDKILVQITNQGPPVAAEHLERIFDKFFRITNADQVTGTGLGLSICKGIIEAHGGRIWAENLPEGFTFMFTLPYSRDGFQPPRVEIGGE
jgi:two-component system sensor histidine kinase KdpD